MQRNPRLVQALETLIQRECNLYREYVAILEEERKFLVKFDSERVTELTEKRNELHNRLLLAQDARFDLLRKFDLDAGKSLTDLLKEQFHPEDARRLVKQVRALRALVRSAQLSGHEHTQIVNFALKIVHGTLSIIWSATQNVVRSYSKQGTMKESYNPTKSRDMGVLKKA